MSINIDPSASHAVYAPSSAHRWMHCTASAEAISRLPAQESGEAAIAGTEAHEELERILKGGVPDGDHEAAYGVALFVDFVRQIRTNTPGQEWIEERVALTPQIWGRLDYGHWFAPDAIVTIADKKNGFVDVPVEENEQLRIYGASLIQQYRLPAKWVRYVIVQPNSIAPGPRVKQWIEPIASLNEFATRAVTIPAGPREFVAGEACKYCPLFGRCPASQDVLTKLSVMLANPADSVPMEQRAIFKACEKPITDWFKSADKAWTKDALSGRVAPGMKLVTATTRRAWKDEAAARAQIVEKFGPDALELPTPAQAEKLGLDISDLASAPEGGPVLAFESDRRKPFERRSVESMFGAVTAGAGQ